jgi:hypothetical protein
MHASRKLGNGSIMNTDSKGQVRCIQTLTVQVEGSLFETSKFSLYFSGSCIPINSKLSYIFEMAGKCVPKTRLRAKRRAFTIGNGWSYKVGNFTAFSLRQGKIMLSLNPVIVFDYFSTASWRQYYFQSFQYKQVDAWPTWPRSPDVDLYSHKMKYKPYSVRIQDGVRNSFANRWRITYEITLL